MLRPRIRYDAERAGRHRDPHLDHGHAMTTYSSRGQSADGPESVSRGRYDAQIYTNNAATLGQELSRDVSHSPAIQQEPAAHSPSRGYGGNLNTNRKRDGAAGGWGLWNCGYPAAPSEEHHG